MSSSTSATRGGWVEGEFQQQTEPLTNEGVPPEYLFIERCIRWVKPGGKIGIVVPRGLLDNDKVLSVRTLIFRETRVLAVVNCHDDTFKPHTNAKAALLVLERKNTDRHTKITIRSLWRFRKASDTTESVSQFSGLTQRATPS